MKPARKPSISPPESPLMREIDREKQASRAADARDLASGRKSREDLSRDNSLFHGRHWSVDFDSAKRLW
jgi:hypothetical protein